MNFICYSESVKFYSRHALKSSQLYSRHALKSSQLYSRHALKSSQLYSRHALKGQKLLAQGIALGIHDASLSPCKGKSFIIS